ncbi:MAG TPA: hypothetical protein VHD56_15590 [Tepidisphaeraceae bacterium]|nr:hypothetical protein [Tepidisphaeraceae bacterium]
MADEFKKISKEENLKDPFAWPLLVTAVFLAALTYKPVAQRLAAPFPLSPWESTIVRDGWRVSNGESIYVLPDRGPATHMYGPLVTYISGTVFRLTGPSICVPRGVAFVFAMLTVIAFPLVLLRGVDWSFGNSCLRLFVAAMTFAQFFRCRALYAEARPDAAAAFFALAAIAILFMAHKNRSVFWLSMGTIAAVIGFFFKQTAAAAALVPVVAVVCLRPKPFKAQLLMSLVPGTTLVLAIFLMRFFWYPGYYYLIEVPRSFSLQQGLSMQVLYYLVLCNKLFIVVTAIWLIQLLRKNQASFVRTQDKFVWSFAAVIVLGGVAWLGFVKHGGAINSFMPVFLAMAAFAAISLLHAKEWLRHMKFSWWAGALVAFGIGAIFLSDLQSIPRVWVLASTKTLIQGDTNYRRVIARASELPGTVICFDDPTIPLLASGYIGRNLNVELDAVGKAYVPKSLLDEIQRANWVIRVHGSWDELDARLNMTEQGFSIVEDAVIDGPMYTLWKRGPSSTVLPP